MRLAKLVAPVALTLALSACGEWTQAPNDVPVVDDQGGVEFEIDLDSKRKTVTVQKPPPPRPNVPAPRPPAPAPRPPAPAPKAGK